MKQLRNLQSLLFSFLAWIKWSNLSRLGKSNVTSVLALAPILSAFFSLIEKLPLLEGIESRVYSAYLGMCLVGVASIIYRMACPFIILQHDHHLDYIGLYPLIIRERFNQITRQIKDANKQRKLAAADAHFIPRGFFAARAAEWTDHDFPASEDVRRQLLYNYLIHDHSRPLARVVVAVCFGLGSILIASPSLSAMHEIFANRLYK